VVRRIETDKGQLIAAGTAASAALPALPPDQVALRISFAAPSFVSDHAGIIHTEYRTRLDGLDREWTAWSKHTERDFTNLPWRDFTFHVQARDDAGRVGPVASLGFAITPAWWATRWAWTAYGVLGLVGVAGLVRLRTRALLHRAAQLEAIVAERTRELAHSNEQLADSNARLATSNVELARLHQLELDGKIAAQLSEEKARLEVLRYQLNPHFLYNSLNSIYGLLFENARDAGEMVLRLSEFCRATLTGPTDELPTLGAEVAALRSYLDVEKVRWGDKLVLEFDVAAEVEKIRLPPFLLLPLVENAIKYGSRTSPGVLRLKISARRVDRALLVEVANTGQWLPPDRTRADSTGIGLENLRQRLRRYYPDVHTFHTEAADGWVTARLTIDDYGWSAELAGRRLAETRQI
jgi:signal transduction histidine kinase